MPENKKDQNNALGNSSSDTIEEAVWRLKIQTDDDENQGLISSYPDRPNEPDCIYYLRTGLCGYGSNCRFNHPTYTSKDIQNDGELPQRVGQPDCGYFIKTGTCKYGPTCKYHHPHDRQGAAPLLFNSVGLPMREEERSCPFYVRTGLCKFGSACKFNHPEATTNQTVLGLTGSASFMNAESSSILPSPGLTFGTWSPYPHHGPSSSGGILEQGWSTYVGNMSHMSSTTSIPHYPERPNEQECRYFMNHGTCKYGSTCKYHHPKERIAQLATNTIGPYGLPLRPGQPVCSYYTLYGICKYGPTCKFDHPLGAGYYYNYPLQQPPMLVDPSLYLPRNSVANQKSHSVSIEELNVKDSSEQQADDSSSQSVQLPSQSLGHSSD